MGQQLIAANPLISFTGRDGGVRTRDLLHPFGKDGVFRTFREVPQCPRFPLRSTTRRRGPGLATSGSPIQARRAEAASSGASRPGASAVLLPLHRFAGTSGAPVDRPVRRPRRWRAGSRSRLRRAWNGSAFATSSSCSPNKEATRCRPTRGRARPLTTPSELLPYSARATSPCANCSSVGVRSTCNRID